MKRVYNYYKIRGIENKFFIGCIIVFLIISFLLYKLHYKIFNHNLKLMFYEVSTEKIWGNVRVAFLSDLHSCHYGKDQQELLQAIYQQKPDIILLGGDIVDDILPREPAEIVLRELANRYPCFYVSGNHEYRSGEISKIKKIISEYNITILEGNCSKLEINNNLISICGVDDYEIGEREYKKQLEKIEREKIDGLYTIFLAHRPEWIDIYLKYSFDLIFTGHAHGGQWRIPGILNGLYAPNQGLFPKYAGGKYDFENSTFIVSRGLAKESTRIPRIFNPPELVIVDIKGIQKTPCEK